LFALEKLKPQLQKLAGAETFVEKPAEVRIEPELCRACGHGFIADETSCAACGASRTTGKYPGTELQSKWAALWDRQLADLEQGPSFRKNAPPVEMPERQKESPIDLDLEAEVAQLQNDPHSGEVNLANDCPAETALVPAPHAPSGTEPLEAFEQVDTVPVPVSSEPAAVAPHSWIERFRTIAVRRGGDLSLVLAGLVCAVVLVWGLRSQPPAHTNPTGSANTVRRRPKPKPPELSLLEKTLVALGIAVPPPAPAYMGDPNIKVWVDLQTGLYYCPGNSLYGTTAKGRYATQSEAQEEAFEPAARKPCD
jgi:ribosomal protein L37E